MQYLLLDDLLRIGARVLCTNPEVLRRTIRLNEADSALHAPQASFDGVEPHEGLARKIAVLGYRILRNHPFPDGNKRIAFLAMQTMAELNGLRLDRTPAGETDMAAVDVLRASAAGSMNEEGFAAWIARWLKQP